MVRTTSRRRSCSASIQAASSSSRRSRSSSLATPSRCACASSRASCRSSGGRRVGVVVIADPPVRSGASGCGGGDRPGWAVAVGGRPAWACVRAGDAARTVPTVPGASLVVSPRRSWQGPRRTGARRSAPLGRRPAWGVDRGAASQGRLGGTGNGGVGLHPRGLEAAYRGRGRSSSFRPPRPSTRQELASPRCGGRDQVVGRLGQEVDEVRRRGRPARTAWRPSARARRSPRRGTRPRAARPPRSRIGAHHPLVHRGAVVEACAGVAPLPQLGARDLGRRGVLHQVRDRDRAAAAEPCREVLDARRRRWCAPPRP